MSNNLDHLFKKALLDKSCDPPPYIWKNIEKQLNRKKPKIGLWWIRGTVAAAMIASLAGIWLLHSVESPKIEVAGITNIIDTQNSIQYNSPEEKNNSCLDTILNENSQPAITCSPPILVAQNVKTELSLANIHSSGQIEAVSCSSPAPIVNTIRIRHDFIPLTSKEGLQNQREYLELIKGTKQSLAVEKRKIKIALSGHFIPTYSSGSYSSSLKNSRGRDYSENQMNGLMNAGGGIKLSVATGKRFSVQTGLFYSRMGQKTSESGTGVRAMALSSLQNSDQVIATPLGNIKSHTKAVGYRSPEAIVLNSLNSNIDQTIEQTFGAIEIPLYARYQLNNNKVLFSVTGGLSGNFIVNNKVFLKNGSDKEYIGSTEDIRNFNISTNVGLGMEYPVTQKIKIMVEPGFKYYLQSLSKNAHIDFKPYMFTFATGIGIEF